MAWMLLASQLERNIDVFVMQRPLPDLGPRISFSCRGAVIARGWPVEDDVDLLLDRAFGFGVTSLGGVDRLGGRIVRGHIGAGGRAE
ncbi:hypothetical protein B296_00053787 [Ensete ventricosum]|uniref:Uncharacterized protein n=1 Tax=Ensete ventricosum TaxID=4639 RepID=A0A426WY68_ENSVE|nr:hypothetical protein B296_00053787 [Ensete ventricosum]